MRCKAQNRKHEQCGRHAVPGREVCVMHGGKSPRGIAASRFKTGRYSKDLPTRLAGRYQEALEDPDLLKLRDEIAILEARSSELIGNLHSGESGHLWQILNDYADKLVLCRRKGDTAGMAQSLNQIIEIIQKGDRDTRTWDEIYRSFEQTRRLTESEVKRLMAMKNYLSAEELMTLLATVIDCVKNNVTDKTALAAIARDFEILTSKIRQHE